MDEPITDEIRALAKAVVDMKHGGTHLSYQDVQAKLFEIVDKTVNNPCPNSNAELTAAIVALTEFLKANLSAVTKADLKDTEARLLKAFGERVDPKAVAKLVTASDALEQAVDANRAKISG